MILIKNNKTIILYYNLSMANSNSFIISIYNSRKNLLEILNERGFNIEKYSDFGITEIGILIENNQLDMLLENETTKKKVYVKFYIYVEHNNTYFLH